MVSADGSIPYFGKAGKKEVNHHRFWNSLSRNHGAVVSLMFLLGVLLVALMAPLISPYSPETLFEGSFNLPPCWFQKGDHRFILGTDDIGRDLLSRLIFGARISMGVGVMVVSLSLLVGGSLGLLSGYVGGWVDQMILRSVDALMALPSILLALVVVAVLGPGLWHAVLAVSFISLPPFIRIVRASVSAQILKPYVEATVSFGASHWRIALGHILPNCLAPLIVQVALGFSDGILNVAALGFLGLGAQPPTPEWGAMLADSRLFMESSWWLVTFPGLCILLVVLGFNLLGDGLRDAWDPRLR